MEYLQASSEVISGGNGAFGCEDLKCDPGLFPTVTTHPDKW